MEEHTKVCLALGKYNEKVNIIEEKEETKENLSNIDENTNAKKEKNSKDNFEQSNLNNLFDYLKNLLKKLVHFYFDFFSASLK